MTRKLLATNSLSPMSAKRYALSQGEIKMGSQVKQVWEV